MLLPLPDAVERILVRAEAKDRLIVAWSEHELNIVKEHCPEKLERFEPRFVNARRVAVRWRNKCHAGKRPDENTLAAYLDLIGYPVAPGAGPGRAGETIRIVRTSLEKGRGLAGLTENQLHRWRICASTTATTASACARSASRPPARSRSTTEGRPELVGLVCPDMCPVVWTSDVR